MRVHLYVFVYVPAACRQARQATATAMPAAATARRAIGMQFVMEVKSPLVS